MGAIAGGEDKSRINDLTRQVEENNQQITLQKQEIRQLKEQIIRLVDGSSGGIPHSIPSNMMGGQNFVSM